ncbi:MAG: DUF4249 family protein [Bacteroidota bacterium]
MRKVLIILTIAIAIASCEDVVDVDLPPQQSKLVVNGILRVDETQEFVPVKIRVGETSDFFSSNPVTNLETAKITYGVPFRGNPSLFDTIFISNLAEIEPGSGIYEPDPNFDSDQRIRTEFVNPDTEFILEFVHEGRQYFSRTPYSPVVPIENVEQGTETLFDDDDTEVKITITDIADVENYYVFDFGKGEFLAIDDQFIDGQEFEFSYFVERDLIPGEELEISLLGADEKFYNYIDLLVEQTEDDAGVFETPAVTVRGNVFDVTGLDNILVFDNVERPNDFALGYFAVVQEFKDSLLIE